VGTNCCGDVTQGSSIYAVYRNPDFTGCYEPPVPGTSIAGNGNYPVACYSTWSTSSVTRIAPATNTVSGEVVIHTKPPGAPYGGVTGFTQYELLGCWPSTALTGSYESIAGEYIEHCMAVGASHSAAYIGLSGSTASYVYVFQLYILSY